MADIVNMRDGERLHSPGEVNEAVVDFAKEILERARSGEINGLHVSMRNATGAHMYRLVGTITISTIGNVELMKQDLIEQLK